MKFEQFFLLICWLLCTQQTLMAINLVDSYESSSDICKTVNNTNQQFHIMTVGITQTKLILLTTDYYVYEVNLQQMNSTIDMLYIQAKPIAMSNKYPKLWNNDLFQKNINSYHDAVIIVDNDGSWFCFIHDKSNDDGSGSGINYNFNTGNIHSGWDYTGSSNEILISTKEPKSLYSIRKKPDTDNLQMTKLQLNGESVTKNSGIKHLFPYKNLCWFEKFSIHTTIIVMNDDCFSKNMQPIDLPILKGFIIDSKFYLFSNDSVYIFNEIAIFDNYKPYPLSKKSYGTFFWCPDHLNSISKMIPSRYVWLIFVSILILLMSLILLLFLNFSKTPPPSKQKKLSKIQSSIYDKSIRSNFFQSSNVQHRPKVLTEIMSKSSTVAPKISLVNERKKSALSSPSSSSTKPTVMKQQSTFTSLAQQSSSNDMVHDSNFY